MSTTRMALTQEDIRTLVKGATDQRAAAANKLCRVIESLPLDDAEPAARLAAMRASCATILDGEPDGDFSTER